MSDRDNPDTDQLIRELDAALEYVNRHCQTHDLVVNLAMLRTLRAILCITGTTYNILIGEDMALNTSNLDQNLATLNTDVDALIASHGTTEAQAQTVVDNAAASVAAVDAKVKAATAAPATPPTPTPAPPAQ